MQDANDHSSRGNSSVEVLLRRSIDETIHSLGGPIYKTITWHMNSKGLFSESNTIDIRAFYNNLKELVGPGADMIMEEAWQKVKKNYKDQLNFGSGSPVDRMIKMISSEESGA